MSKFLSSLQFKSLEGEKESHRPQPLLGRSNPIKKLGFEPMKIERRIKSPEVDADDGKANDEASADGSRLH